MNGLFPPPAKMYKLPKRWFPLVSRLYQKLTARFMTKKPLKLEEYVFLAKMRPVFQIVYCAFYACLNLQVLSKCYKIALEVFTLALGS